MFPNSRLQLLLQNLEVTLFLSLSSHIQVDQIPETLGQKTASGGRQLQ
jgi:hypothetical protein